MFARIIHIYGATPRVFMFPLRIKDTSEKFFVLGIASQMLESL